MNEHQLGMITSNIDLYKVKDVKDVDGCIEICGADGSRFSIAYGRLPKSAHNEVLSSIKPLFGKEPEKIHKSSVTTVVKNALHNYTYNIFGGIVLIGLAAIGHFTGTIYSLGRHGPLEKANDEYLFAFFLVLHSVLGVGTLIYGVIGKLRQRNA
ncbi:hypothetical protein [Biformimicrobium ophioploci]|uniref:Uncharacterized protein n=1 Tax=Biformimicrobium ophioploci TaxID=3036711 RepID=A0ABQ6M345_9GAMM|nr:hypothetical protein [Microbulbifer sp. NKW57]GMG88765.1 hypothetical protein MNKW57_30860 [Microbulbifer sp. NKW57]